MREKKIEISIIASILPIIILIILLAVNVGIYGDDSLNGSNQFILLVGAFIAAIVGYFHKVSYKKIINSISKSVKATTSPILILLFVGALAGTWLISGIIPAMIYYGLQIFHPLFFLPACVIICAIISISTGSSWTTSATIGIALVGIGKAMEINTGIVAGAIISGAYFGDKLSPLSDTTNLASAMANSNLFNHIRYMTLTTVPSIIISLLFFISIGFFQESTDNINNRFLFSSIEEKFFINPILFIVPIVVIVMILKKTPPLIALMMGTILAALFALIFQQNIILELTSTNKLTINTAYKAIIDAITIETSIKSSNEILAELFKSGGMKGMLGTIWLIICAMVFGGVMDAIGALKKISEKLLEKAENTFQLIFSTSASCLTVNLTASDQYLSIVVPGKMFQKAYQKRNLAPENLSRTLEDSGTVTSVLIPWNTCGAYQSSVLGVSVIDYFAYAIFNWISPFVTLSYAYFGIKIKKLVTKG